MARRASLDVKRSRHHEAPAPGRTVPRTARRIVIYLASEFLDEALGWVRWTGAGGKVVLRDWLYRHLFPRLASPYNASLIYAVSYVLVMFLIAVVLYRRGWFVRV